jgi:hypothetical protein
MAISLIVPPVVNVSIGLHRTRKRPETLVFTGVSGLYRTALDDEMVVEFPATGNQPATRAGAP